MASGLLVRAAAGAAKAAVAVLAIVVIWWAVIHGFGIEPFFMPGPAVTFESLWEDRGELASAAWVTLKGGLVGLAASTAFASILAVLVVRSTALRRTVLPIAIVIRNVPIIAIAPLITLVIGRGLKTSVVAVTIVTFFPIFAYLSEGFCAVTSEMNELMRLYDATFMQKLRHVRVRVALPFLFAGLQDGARAAVLAAMLAEWLTGTEGLGVELARAASARRSDLVWAVVIVATSLALAMFYTTKVLEQEVNKRSTI